MFTIHEIQKKFPEAKPVWRGNGEGWTVNCWKYHKHGGLHEMEIGPTGVFHCHNCGHAGVLQQEFPEYFDPLSEIFPDLFIQREAPKEPPQGSRVRRSGVEWAPGIESPGEVVPLASLEGQHPACDYLASRGFDLEEIRALDATRALYYCTRGIISFTQGKGTTSGRIVFPIYMDGKLMGWQARQIERRLDEETREVWNGFGWRKFRKLNDEWEDRFVPKYYTCPGMKRGSVLYGFDMARNYKEIAIVEGPLDYHRVGPACVGTLGKNITPDQVRLMKAYWSRLFLLRDPEINPRDPKFLKILEDLAPLPTHHLALAGGLDPGATPRDDTWKQIVAQVRRDSNPNPIGMN